MPTKSSYQSQPACQVQHRQHGLRRDRQRDLVGDDEAMRAMEFLVAQGSRPRVRAGARRSAPGRRPGRDSATAWPARAASGIRAGAQPAQPAEHHQRRVDALRAGAPAGTAPGRGVDAPPASQSLSTMRCRPSPRSCGAGRCVWPWISVRASAACSQSRAAGGVDVGPDHRPGRMLAVFALRRAWRARSARRSSSGRARKSRCQAAVRHLARESAGSRCRPGRAGRHGSAASAGPEAPAPSGSASSSMPAARAKSAPSRKSRLPCMKKSGPPLGGLRAAARRSRLRSRAAVGRVVADPDLEQVAEDEDRIGRRGLEVAVPGVEGRGLRGLQMQVGDAGRPCASAAARRARRRRPARPCCSALMRQALTTAFSITTSSSGTSSWKPLRPVFTALILSTTSLPSMTLPNTA